MPNYAYEHDNDLPTVDIHNRESRSRLAKMIMRLLDHWAVPTDTQCLLLGLSPKARTSLARYRKGEPFAESMDMMGRAGHLLGIHKSLRIIFPHDRDLAYQWVSQPNRRFGGHRPVDIMSRSYEGLLAIRRYLDFERGR